MSTQTARPASRASRHVKRWLDLALALVLAFALAPLMLLLAALVRGSDGGPALFRQDRIGRGGRLFRCWKFRTMACNAEQALADYIAGNPEAAREWRECQKLTHDPRVTALGAFLRKSSLDELPQLYNILVGEMSFVGPRPIVAAEVERYGDAFQQCFSVPPGLTGLWQISGRSDCSYAHRVALDSRYASEWDLLLDAEIMLKTVPAVLLQKGSR
nr:sugar transferase [Bosea sp. BH3]